MPGILGSLGMKTVAQAMAPQQAQAAPAAAAAQAPIPYPLGQQDGGMPMSAGGMIRGASYFPGWRPPDMTAMNAQRQEAGLPPMMAPRRPRLGAPSPYDSDGSKHLVDHASHGGGRP